MEIMNSTRPESDQVPEDEFFSGLKKQGIDPHALSSYENFVECLTPVPLDERPDWFNDLIESDPPSLKQIKKLESELIEILHNFLFFSKEALLASEHMKLSLEIANFLLSEICVSSDDHVLCLMRTSQGPFW